MPLSINNIILNNKIIIWDNDGTIMGSKNPHDVTLNAKIILPNIKKVMAIAKLNFVISGFKSPESEAQNFDPEMVIEKFTTLMQELPISAATFSPAIGGIACYGIIKKNNTITIIKAHENALYTKYIGNFKKPDIGMFHVIHDIALTTFASKINAQNTLMIGDTWHDKAAAEQFGIPFLDAHFIHTYNSNP